MPKIGNYVSSSELPCDRCGSKKRVAKTWTEKIKTDHSLMLLQHKEIVCTNAKCQKEFEEVLKKENEKRAKIQQAKIDNAAQRAAGKKPLAA